MAIPNSGELGLYKDIWGELGGTKGENSLHSASVAVGFATPDSMGDFYGYVDATQPSMGGVTLTSVTCTAMTANSSYSTPAGTPVAYGFYFGRGSSNHTQNTKYTESNTGGLSANFNRSFTSLQSTATYYAWSWASNSAGEGVSSRAQATTQTPLPASQNFGACACNYVCTYAQLTNNHGPSDASNGGISYTHPNNGGVGLGSAWITSASQVNQRANNFTFPRFPGYTQTVNAGGNGSKNPSFPSPILFFHVARHQAPGVAFKSPSGATHSSQAGAGINLNNCFFAFVGCHRGRPSFSGNGHATYN